MGRRCQKVLVQGQVTMVWREEDHPRVPAGNIYSGQFTDDQLTTASKVTEVYAGLRSPEENIIERAGEIADLDHERLYIFYPDPDRPARL